LERKKSYESFTQPLVYSAVRRLSDIDIGSLFLPDNVILPGEQEKNIDNLPIPPNPSGAYRNKMALGAFRKRYNRHYTYEKHLHREKMTKYVVRAGEDEVLKRRPDMKHRRDTPNCDFHIPRMIGGDWNDIFKEAIEESKPLSDLADHIRRQRRLDLDTLAERRKWYCVTRSDRCKKEMVHDIGFDRMIDKLIENAEVESVSTTSDDYNYEKSKERTRAFSSVSPLSSSSPHTFKHNEIFNDATNLKNKKSVQISEIPTRQQNTSSQYDQSPNTGSINPQLTRLQTLLDRVSRVQPPSPSTKVDKDRTIDSDTLVNSPNRLKSMIDHRSKIVDLSRKGGHSNVQSFIRPSGITESANLQSSAKRSTALSDGQSITKRSISRPSNVQSFTRPSGINGPSNE